MFWLNRKVLQKKALQIKVLQLVVLTVLLKSMHFRLGLMGTGCILPAHAKENGHIGQLVEKEQILLKIAHAMFANGFFGILAASGCKTTHPARPKQRAHNRYDNS